MDSVGEIVDFIRRWIEREYRHKERAEEIQDERLAHDCERRIFTLELLLTNIE